MEDKAVGRAEPKKPPVEDGAGPEKHVAWAEKGRHAHGRFEPKHPETPVWWYFCDCKDGEALRPAWAECDRLGCPKRPHEAFHKPPTGSFYVHPPPMHSVRS